MAKYRIAWMPGDGIGNDVMEAAKLVLDELDFDAEYVPADIGWEFWCSEGDAFPERTIELLENVDAALFGAITSKPNEEAQAELAPELKSKNLTYQSPIVRLRQHFNLAVNLRPCKAYPGNPLNFEEGIDLVVYRENTEDLYVGVEYHPVPESLSKELSKHPKWARFIERSALEDIAISLRINTREGCRNIVKAAFEHAKTFGYPTVTVVEKPNVVRETSGLMVRTAREVAAEYPGIDLWETNIDAMCMWLVKNPQNYGVLVSTNMFGDIVSDLCAQLVGGLGFASSGNIGEKLGVFEPTHGSAPKYAGQYKTNPMAMVLTAKLMLDWLGEKDEAERLDAAVAKTILEGKARTYDMGGTDSTLEVAAEIARNL
jgi:3-isopropylmalate dehydrogenase